MSAEAAEAAEAISPRLAAIDEEHLSRSVIRLAWPVVVQQVSFTMVQLVDTLLVGHLGRDALAGVGLGAILFWFPQAGIFAVGIGATAVVARNVGAGFQDRAVATVNSALLLGLAWGLVAALAMGFGAEALLRLMGAEAAARAEGVTWMQAAALGLPFSSFLYAGSACLQGAGDTRTPMLIMLGVNLVNALVAYVLINGPGPFPRLEVLGSGLGATTAAVTGAAMVALALARGRGGLRYNPLRPPSLDPEETRRILKVGLPAGLENFQFNVAFLVYTRIISSLGSAAIAAHRVALTIEGLAWNPGFALGVATTTLVGQSLGARRPDLAERASGIALRWAVLIMTTIGVLVMLLGGPITSLFVGGEGSEEVVDIGGRLLFIFGFAMPALAVSLSLSGGLRGAGDTRSVLAIAVFGLWVVRLLPAYLLAIPGGFGVPGAWLAAVIDINTRGLLVWLRFRRGRWKEIKL